MLFDRFNTDSASLSEHRDRFASALFALLTRYDTLESGGLQSSLIVVVFDFLLNRFDCQTECFASPFNPFPIPTLPLEVWDRSLILTLPQRVVAFRPIHRSSLASLK